MSWHLTDNTKKRNFLIWATTKEKNETFILQRISLHWAGVFTDMANNKHVCDSINCKWLWWPQSERALRRDSNVRWGKTFLPLVDWSYESCSAHSLVEEFKRWGRKSGTDLLFSVVYLKHVCIKTLEVSAKQSDDFYC